MAQDLISAPQVKIKEKKAFKKIIISYKNITESDLIVKGSPLKCNEDSIGRKSIFKKRLVHKDCEATKTYYHFFKQLEDNIYINDYKFPEISPNKKNEVSFYYSKDIVCDYIDYVYNPKTKKGIRIIVSLDQVGKDVKYRLEEFTK